MNHATADTQATCTPETHILHLILQAIIVDGSQRMRPETDIKANAESAARAFRAGLAAFTAPPEALTGEGTNAALGVTRHGGSAKQYGASESISHMPTAACNGNGLKSACKRCSGMLQQPVDKRTGTDVEATHLSICIGTGDPESCRCRLATSV